MLAMSSIRPTSVLTLVVFINRPVFENFDTAPVPPTEPVVEEKCSPCSPSPCGPYSVCREVDCRAVCSCQATYVGAPPTCRPECVLNSDCASTQACINQKCANPCAEVCGENAECRVVNHNPICNCPRGFTGDPFSSCRPIPGNERNHLRF